MQIQVITVKAGRTVNHPHESYSNLRQDVELTASLEAGDDPTDCIKRLQRQAEQCVEDHKNNLLQSIEELAELQTKQREVASLSRQIAEAQARLDRLRESVKQPSLAVDAALVNE